MSRLTEAEAHQAKVLTTDEARRVASTIALPELLGARGRRLTAIKIGCGAGEMIRSTRLGMSGVEPTR